MIEIPLPLPVARAITTLGRDISLARRRRGMTQRSLAERIGSSLKTVQRLEKGDPRIPLHYIGRTLYVFGELERLLHLLGTGEDVIGLTLMNERVPQRVRNAKKSAQSGSL
ncbi:MAG: helix-turn-helix domain-containing protein [Pseudomonadota bacterium]|nr:helix-turn-helix domain-containing protein [Pseudomonadota bacterium]